MEKLMVAVVVMAVVLAAVVGLVIWNVVRKPSASNVSTEVVPPVIEATNLQGALLDLTRTATGERQGMMSELDRERLDALEVKGNAGFTLGPAIYTACNDACCTIASTFTDSTSGTGSGFAERIVGTTLYIVTAAHVVLKGSSPPFTQTSKVEACFPTGVQVVCTVLGTDPAADVAVLTATAPAGQKVLQWGSSTTTSIGARVFGIGNPGNADFASFSMGAVRDNKYVSSSSGGSVLGMTTDVAIYPGNSGGPFLSASGQVLGLSNWIRTDTEGRPQNSFSGGVAQVIAQPLVQRIIDNGGSITKGFLGLASAEVVAGLVLSGVRTAHPTFTGTARGLIVRSIFTTGGATGLQNATPPLAVGDIIVSLTIGSSTVDIGVFGDQTSPTVLTWLSAPGTAFSLKYFRPPSNTELTATGTLAAYPSSEDKIFSGATSAPFVG